jgi:hypothetical protein
MPGARQCRCATVDNSAPRWKASEALHLAPAPSLVIGTRGGEMY